ncbi:MAG: ABC transporter substrate-binding protein [Deltaproteobacteria bacterium]|jgi:NitT/TauT family transport system substrate-binding protein|nr:ABC transporter substrate-binding protein [Deltaproteobacteria bacterium]
MQTIKRTVRAAVVAAALAALALVAPRAATLSAQEAAAPRVIRAGYTGSLCEGPIHIAHERGFFKEEGLDVELVKLEPGANFEAIAAGQIDASFGLLATLIQPLSNGLPIKITTGLHTGCDKVLVKPDSGIRTAADLRGKRIGVPSLTSSPIMFTRRALAAAGVKVGDKDSEVEFLVFTNAELPLALQRGAIDAIGANDPVASLAASSDGLTILLDSARDKPFSDQYCCAAYVSARLAASDPEAAARYTRAMQKAAAWIQKNPDETARLQVDRKYVAGQADFNASVLKTFRYIPSVSGAYNAFGVTAGELKQIGVLGEKVDVEALRAGAFAQLPDVPDTIE